MQLSLNQLVQGIAAEPSHRAGCLNPEVLWALANYAPADLRLTAETGCGRSTILMTHLLTAPDARHYVFTFDDRHMPGSSVGQVEGSALTLPGKIDYIYGPTQQTLVDFDFGAAKAKTSPAGFDLVILDGPHSWPFLELEYYRFYPHIRPGGILVIDDIHIPSIRRFFDILRGNDNYLLLDVVLQTAFFRRTDVPALDPLGDDWSRHGYNMRHYPEAVPALYAPLTGVIDFTAGGNGEAYINGGFGAPQANGSWTVTPTASLMLSVPPQPGMVLEFDLGETRIDPARVTATVNLQPAALDFDGAIMTVAVPDGAQNGAGRLLVAFDLPGVISPYELTRQGYDFNKYGLLLRRLAVKAG